MATNSDKGDMTTELVINASLKYQHHRISLSMFRWQQLFKCMLERREWNVSAGGSWEGSFPKAFSISVLAGTLCTTSSSVWLIASTITVRIYWVLIHACPKIHCTFSQTPPCLCHSFNWVASGIIFVEFHYHLASIQGYIKEDYF